MVIFTVFLVRAVQQFKEKPLLWILLYRCWLTLKQTEEEKEKLNLTTKYWDPTQRMPPCPAALERDQVEGFAFAFSLHELESDQACSLREQLVLSRDCSRDHPMPEQSVSLPKVELKTPMASIEGCHHDWYLTSGEERPSSWTSLAQQVNAWKDRKCCWGWFIRF